MTKEYGRQMYELAEAILAPQANIASLVGHAPALREYTDSSAFLDWEQDLYVGRSLQALAKLEGVDPDTAWSDLWQEHEAVGLAGMSHARRVFLLSLHFYYDRDNGGLSQWFWNADGDMLLATPDALRQIGLTSDPLDIEKGIALFPNLEIVEDQQRRQQFMRKMWAPTDGDHDPWDISSGAFENCEGRCWKWLLAHVDAFTRG